MSWGGGGNILGDLSSPLLKYIDPKRALSQLKSFWFCHDILSVPLIWVRLNNKQAHLHIEYLPSTEFSIVEEEERNLGVEENACSSCCRICILLAWGLLITNHCLFQFLFRLTVAKSKSAIKWKYCRGNKNIALQDHQIIAYRIAIDLLRTGINRISSFQRSGGT